MMMGTAETDVNRLRELEEELEKHDDDVLNDFEITEVKIPAHENELYLKRVAARVANYDLKIVNEPRDGKKLLVLDIDYTLFDFKSTAANAMQLKRPFLHEFLTEAYKHYDIIIWSATSMRWIEIKMSDLGVTTHAAYKIVAYMDVGAMVGCYTEERGLVRAKPLQVIWGKFPARYSPRNTIMFDDCRRNFVLNPQSGLRIRAYKNAAQAAATDRELVHLSRYLTLLRFVDDFTELDHRKWEKYVAQNQKKLPADSLWFGDDK